jgi:hypothetical protein
VRRSLLLSLLGLTVLVACGGGPARNDDPAVLDACLEWSNEVCHLAAACVEPADWDSGIRARFGSSADDCYVKLLNRCQTNQTSNPFGPSCGPGKVVDQAALDACVFDVYNVLCNTWTPDVGDCQDVCVPG